MMKKILLSVVMAFVLQTSFTQMYFYGMTSAGAKGGYGSIFKYKVSDPTKPILVHEFEVEAPGNTPDKCEPIELSDGQLWGTTGYGGKYGRGVIYAYNFQKNIYTLKHSFNGTEGSVSFAGLIQADDKMLYGGTFRGGKGDSGVIYRFDPVNNVFTKLFDLSDFKIAGITDRLVQHSDGRIYGTTFVGYAGGVLFSFDPDAPTSIEIHYQFEQASGYRPVGGLTMYKGVFYGVTRLGGQNNLGVLYSYDPSTNAYQKIRDLERSSGTVGVGSMTLYKDKLYGLLSNGGKSNFGVIYSFDPATSSYTMITSFPGKDTSLGVFPLGALHLTKDNKLIGVSSNGGKYRGGALFELDPETETVKQIGAFNFDNGYHPKGTPVRASNGKIYAMGYDGGLNSLGALLVQDKEVKDNPPSTVFNLNNSKYGGSPCATFIQASDGMMYGTARFGGKTGLGVVLQLNPNTDKVKIVGEFNWINGARPLNDFTEYNGKLYCTTSLGGPDDLSGDDPGIGTVSSLDLKTFELKKEARFDVVDGKAPNGGVPYTKLILAPNGKMYGTTFRGGKNDLGAIFEFDPATKTIKALYSFDITSGYRPIGSMAMGEGGWMYGFTQKGGKSRKGTIYKFNYKTGDFGVIEPFGGRIAGRNVQSAPLYVDGVLYGLSYEGGQYRMGTLFKYEIDLSKFTRIANFDGKNGAYPFGGLTMGPDGKIYAFSSYGGSENAGTAFRIDPKTDEMEKLWDFKYDFGAIPYFTAPGLYNPSLAAKSSVIDDTSITLSPNPTKDYIHVQGVKGKIRQVQILHIDGSLVREIHSARPMLFVSSLSPGTYLLKIWTTQQTAPVIKSFVVMR